MAKQSWWRRLWFGLDPVPPPTDDSAPPRVREPTLEDEITDLPDSLERYLVYGDWLQERDDPRGTLISLQARCTPRFDETRSNDMYFTFEPWRVLDGEHAAAARDLIAKFPIRLGGDLDPEDHAEWFCGFWRRLRLRPPTVKQATMSLKARLEAVLQHDSARFLRSLSIGTSEFRDLVKFLPPLPTTLRTLHLGEPMYPKQEGSYFGSIAPLPKVAPRLEQLVLQGPSVDLGERIELPCLRSLELFSLRLSAGAVQAVAHSELPLLHTLVLYLHNPALEPADLRELFAASLPGLRELVLPQCRFIDDIVGDLIAAPWFPQLRVLDLRLGTMTARGVTILENARERLANLERLEATLDDQSLARIAALIRRGAA